MVLVILVLRLFFLQVLDGSFYRALAAGQHELYKELFARRGDILVRDWVDGTEYVAATMSPKAFLYADPRKVTDPVGEAYILASLLGYDVPPANGAAVPNIPAADALTMPTSATNTETDQLAAQLGGQVPAHTETAPDAATAPIVAPPQYPDYQKLVDHLSKKNDPYEPLVHGVREDIITRIEQAKLAGVYSIDELSRTYPESGLSGQILGFMGVNADGEKTGTYGIEGFENAFLAGTNGFLHSVTDPQGHWIGIGGRAFEPAVNGGDILLTLDRTIQYEACKRLARAVEETQSDSGSVVILEPKTGRVMAMCGNPNFEPADYSSVKDSQIFNNPVITHTYEPGSVFKPLIMAEAIEKGVVTPNTTFNDPGEEKIDRFTIRNSDKLAHGIQTMTEVLEKSLNTGMIFVMRKIGFADMKGIIDRFGFGVPTGIELTGEASGNTTALDIQSEIYYATASYGQGITATPLQVAAAYGSIANGGYLMKPYIIEEKRSANGSVEKTIPKIVRQVMSESTAKTVGAMMVSVVEKGHAHVAKIPGYYVAAKTGTAQVPRSDGGGYEADITKATFAGFAPLDNPQFVMVLELDHPRTSPWAEGTAAPAWHDLAQFMLQYFDVMPTRTI